MSKHKFKFSSEKNEGSAENKHDSKTVDKDKNKKDNKSESPSKVELTEKQKKEKEAAEKMVDDFKEEIFKSPLTRDMEQYLKEEREKNRYDPRPDIEEDHYIWQKLLQVAEELDYMGYGLLHGLRCAGCRLKVEKGKLMLNLAESTELLELFIDDEKLEKLGEPEQLAMFGIKEEELRRRRIENEKRAKKKNKLEEEAIDKIKSQELQPNLKNLKLVFSDINEWVNDVNQKNHGVNLLQLNNILADIEYHKERKY